MKSNWSLMMVGLAVVLAGCSTTRSVNRTPEPPTNRLQAQLPDFSTIGQASLSDTGLKLVVAGDSLFKPGHTFLSDDGVNKINALAAILSKYPGDSVTVVVYTDNSGTDAKNLKVSKRRADRIQKELVKQGISVDRVTTMGKGDVAPVAANDTEEGRAQNRRAEFDIAFSQ
jgi:outer membrane protein OmpA-like peptidoglycan-associated protein